ncbi:MAG: xanthine dehydrogenase family protein molybdopterin-binding subunit [Chloroflexi bacterium]|nr:xanthine dehydrogenase family protein molybdopterin-binding subunit [Chloroflexota bacterium]
MATTEEYRVVGKRVPRVDGIDRVTGSAVYPADFTLPGLLHAKIKRSPHAHARIVRIDTSKAEALKGVLAVATAADFPELPMGTSAPLGEVAIDLWSLTRLDMAREKALWVGHPVAAIAATDPHIAEAALDLIEVEYEVLDPVLDIEGAMRADSPVLHDHLVTTGVEPKPSKASNVASKMAFGRGDVEQGFADADVVVERRFKIDVAHQGYLEPQACVVQVDPRGQVTIWTSTQGIFTIKMQVGTLLDIPLSKVKVIALEIGGGFGGKIYAHAEPIAVILARKTGRPVKLVFSREEVLRGTGPGAAALLEIKIGAKSDGTLTTGQARFAYDAGAFPGSPVGAGLMAGFAAYKWQNLKLEGYDVVTNKPRVEAYRGPGAPQAIFGVEQLVDEVAGKLGIDPLELRRRNAVGPGDASPTNRPYPSIGLREVLDAVAAHPHWSAPLTAGGTAGQRDSGTNGHGSTAAPLRGRGLAVGHWPGASMSSACNVMVSGDGTLSITVGTVDLTGTRTSLAQIAAEEFGLEVDDVYVQTGDTESVAYSDVAAGSRTMRTMGAAIQIACQDALAQLKERASQKLECSVDDVEYVGTEFRVKGIPDKSLPLAKVARASLTEAGGPITGRGVTSRMPPAPQFGAHVCDVEVDPGTGRVSVLRYTAFQDVGKAINPIGVEGQIQGGVAQGLGWALTEGYDYDTKGSLRNASLLDYRMPTALDLPMIDCVLVEVPVPGVPYGMRGVGEVPIVPPAGAAANAVAQALGVRIAEMPMTPERILRALRGDEFGEL